MDERKAVYSEFEHDILNRLETMGMELGGIRSILAELSAFAKEAGPRLTTIEVECKHHRERTVQIVTDIDKAKDRLDSHDKLVEQISGGWKATSALAALITVLMNVIGFLVHRAFTGKN